MVSSDTPLVETAEQDDVLTVCLNRPSKLNAINRELLNGLLTVLKRASEDPTHGILFTGAGRATSAGVDLNIVEAPAEEKPDFRAKEHRLFDLDHAYPRPTAVAGKGALIGAAFVIAMDADFVVLGEETTFSFPEIEYRIFSARTTETLEKLVGPKLAKEIVLTGDPVPPERAREQGIVTDVVPTSDVEDRAREFLERVCGHDATAVEKTKAMLTYDYPGPDDDLTS